MKKKNLENDSFMGEDKEIAGRKIEKLKKQRVENDVKKKSKKKNKGKIDEDGVNKKSKKEISVDSENGGKNKSKNNTESEEKPFDNISFNSVGTVEAVESEYKSRKKKKKKNRETTGEDEEIEKLGEGKEKSKKQNVEDDAKKKSKQKSKEKRADDDGAKKNLKEINTDSEDGGKKKMKKKKESGDEKEEPLNVSNRNTGKRKREEIDLGDQENTDNEIKRSRKKKKVSVESDVDAKKKSNEDSEAEEKSGLNSRDAKKKRKKKKKQSEISDGEENNNESEDAKKKQTGTTPSSKSSKKVTFSDKVEYFPAEDEEREHEEEDAELVRGKRFTKEEDEQIKKAVWEYIDNHALGDEGLNMVMDCQNHKEVKGCWKEIESALPWRPRYSVYNRAHTLFQSGSKGIWTKEDLELVKQFQEKHGNDWKTLADAMGKHRIHVKDAWRRIRLNMNKGHWSREEYQSLFDLVNKDIRMKAYQEKHSKHGMLRDNIPWMAISDVLGTRSHITCCMKWYEQLTSPMVVQGIWANVDDYRLLEELLKLDAACIDDVDWDNLLENRDGEACKKRWNQMVRHIGLPKSKTFAEHVEILSERYSPNLAEDRENFDNRPYDPED